MGNFDATQYYRVLIPSLRVGSVVPFNAFILLRANQRIIRFVSTNEIFSEAKANKLSQFNFKEVYVPVEEKESYLSYLRSFFATADGQAVLSEVKAQAESELLEGIPPEIAAEYALPGGNVKVVDDQSPEISLPPPVQGKEKIAEMIQKLRERMDDLDSDIRIEGEISDDDSQKVEGSTKAIEDSMQKVRGLNPDNADDVIKIKGYQDHMNRHLEIIRGIAKKGESQKHQSLDQYAQRLEEQLFIVSDNRKTAEKKLNKEIFGNSNSPKQADQVNRELWHIRQLTQSDAKEVVNEAINLLVKDVQSITGVKPQVKRELVEVDDDPAALGKKYKPLLEDIQEMSQTYHKFAGNHSDKTVLHRHIPVFNKIEELIQAATLAYSPMTDEEKTELDEKTKESINSEKNITETREFLAANPEIEKHLGSIVTEQNKTIFSLKTRIKIIHGILHGIHDKFKEMQNNGEVLRAIKSTNLFEGLNFDLDEMSKACGQLDEGKNQLIFATNRISKLVGVEQQDIESMDPILALQPVTSDAVAGEAPNILENGQGNNKTNDNVYEVAVLLSQLEDAKSLISSNDKKMIELSNLLSGNASYIESIEKELLELRNYKTAIAEKLDEAEGKESRLTTVMNDMDRSLRMDRAHSKEQKEMNFNYRDRIQSLENHLRVYKDLFGDVDVAKGEALDQSRLNALPADVVAIIAKKDEEIAKVHARMESKSEQLKEMQKEVIKLQGKVQSSKEVELSTARKIEKLESEKAEVKKLEQAMLNKVVAVTNLLDESRKSVSKLAIVNEELRRDRMQYMTRTNRALADFKNMSSKANALNSHVEAEIQRNQKMADQYEHVRERHRELTERFTELSRKSKEMEMELRRLKKGGVGGQTGVAGNIESSPNSIELRLNKLSNEHEKLKSQYRQEQSKVNELNRKLKDLQTRLMKSGGEAA